MYVYSLFFIQYMLNLGQQLNTITVIAKYITLCRPSGFYLE